MRTSLLPLGLFLFGLTFALASTVEAESRPHAAVLLAPAVVRVFRDLHLANCVNARPTLSDQNIYLPQLRDYLFRFVSFRCHLRSSVP